MEARYYNAKWARFLQQDPVFLELGNWNSLEKHGQSPEQLLQNPQLQNSYSYVRNNPLNATDPSGATVWFPTNLDPTYKQYFPNNLYSDDPNAIKPGFEIHWGTVTPPGGPLIPEEHRKWLEMLETTAGAANAGKIFGQGVKNMGNLIKDSGILKPKQIGTINRQDLPTHAQDVLNYLEKNKWNPPKNYRGGGKWENKYNQLPNKGNNYYKEYDLSPKIKNIERNGERIIRGNGGELYWTNNHYGSINNGQPAFYKIK